MTDIVRSIGIHITFGLSIDSEATRTISTGIKAEIEVSGFYHLQSEFDIDHQEGNTIEIIYKNQIFLPVDPRDPSKYCYSTFKPADFREGEIVFKAYQ